MSDLDHIQDFKSESTLAFDGKTCPNCGATVTFDPASGEMACSYCGYHCKLPDANAENEICEMDFEAAVNTESYEWGSEKKTVECKSCGAVAIYDALETAAVCPFCGSTHVMPTATENSIAPGAVCPFAVTKESAGDSFTRWLKKKLFTPRKAKQSAQPDAFHGVYLPYWTFDAQTTSSFTARVGYTRVVQRGDKKETVTDWNHVSGVYQEFFDDETVVASKRYEDSRVKDCEPFNFSKLVPYSPQVVAGFAAERYSIGLKDGWEKAQHSIQRKLRTDIEQYAKGRWRADKADSVHFSTLYSNVTYKYILVPVWMSSFKFKDKVFQFVVNGQTGKVAGKAPVSAFRVILAVLLGIGAIVGLYYLLR
ncbi:MAG: TFIIB-type zinc ribbon-containing protein [Bacteroidales bacterium]|nr:TFIIB-type zinc ribbon-containing protein [Bacteroidales bacterium]